MENLVLETDSSADCYSCAHNRFLETDSSADSYSCADRFAHNRFAHSSPVHNL